MINCGVPYEKSVYSDNTTVFSFLIDQGRNRPSSSVTIWEKFSILAALQREWSDNSVSFTGYFDPKTEGDQLELILAAYAPLIKGCSLAPHAPVEAYAQLPYEEISETEYHKLRKGFPYIDWTKLSGNEIEPEIFCTNGVCMIPNSKFVAIE